MPVESPHTPAPARPARLALRIRLVRPALAACLGAALALGGSIALAAPTSSPSPSSAPRGIDQCLADQNVWLLVTDENGATLSNQCVGKPASGLAALHAGGMKTKDRKGLICSVGGHPAQCPATYQGAYWTYYHATPGGEWRYSDQGASSYQPAPGSLEGWCYSLDENKPCTPPSLADAKSLPVTQLAAVTEADIGSPIAVGAVVAVIAGLAGFGWWRHRRTTRRSEEANLES